MFSRFIQKIKTLKQTVVLPVSEISLTKLYSTIEISRAGKLILFALLLQKMSSLKFKQPMV